MCGMKVFNEDEYKTTGIMCGPCAAKQRKKEQDELEEYQKLLDSGEGKRVA
jgi:hypothetical protein